LSLVLIPFVLGDVLKVALELVLLPGAWKLVERLRTARCTSPGVGGAVGGEGSGCGSGGLGLWERRPRAVGQAVSGSVMGEARTGPEACDCTPDQAVTEGRRWPARATLPGSCVLRWKRGANGGPSTATNGRHIGAT